MGAVNSFLRLQSRGEENLNTWGTGFYFQAFPLDFLFTPGQTLHPNPNNLSQNEDIILEKNQQQHTLPIQFSPWDLLQMLVENQRSTESRITYVNLSHT